MSEAAGKTMNLVKRYAAQSNKILGKKLHKKHFKKKGKKEQREREREECIKQNMKHLKEHIIIKHYKNVYVYLKHISLIQSG